MFKLPRILSSNGQFSWLFLCPLCLPFRLLIATLRTQIHLQERIASLAAPTETALSCLWSFHYIKSSQAASFISIGEILCDHIVEVSSPHRKLKLSLVHLKAAFQRDGDPLFFHITALCIHLWFLSSHLLPNSVDHCSVHSTFGWACSQFFSLVSAKRAV